MDRFEETFWSGNSLEELYDTLSARPVSGMGAVFVAGHARMEALVQQRGLDFMGLQARIEKVLDVSIAREASGSNRSFWCSPPSPPPAPFVGLFGTVWGIMTSFRSIAASKNTSLAVVAPGIAEALFATAIGLFAAIPALDLLQQAAGPTWRARRRAWKASPTNSPRSCRARSTSTSPATRPGGMTLQTR